MIAAPEATAAETTTPTVQSPDYYRRRLSQELKAKRHELRGSRQSFERLKNETKETKTRVDRLQAECDEICQDLEDLENGCYTPPELRPLIEPDDDDTVAGEGLDRVATLMHQRQGGGVPFDTGAQAPIQALVEFGLTAKQVEMIQESELARKFEGIETVGHLERAMREDEWWHQKIKGIGKTKIDKVSDALMAFRAKNPVPSRDEEEPTVAGAPDEERTVGVEAGSGGITVWAERRGTVWMARVEWQFDTAAATFSMPGAGQGGSLEAASVEAVRRVLVETREVEAAGSQWVPDIESWLARQRGE
jgi:hypothetical protein